MSSSPSAELVAGGDGVPGRACPLTYRHGAAALRSAATLDAERLWVAGGVYGNLDALRALDERVAADRGARLVLNGDFHWFDVDPDDFAALQDAAARHTLLAGNVETELAEPTADGGCGCAYPPYVDDATVERSNAIMARLQATAAAFPGTRAALGALAPVLRARVAGYTIGIVHGDPDSLAGWQLAIEQVTAEPVATVAQRVRAWADEAGVDAFACSHTCLPWAGRPGDVPVINNGSGGMPNFRGRRFGLATRIAPVGDSARDALYAVTGLGLRFEAIPIAYDTAAWDRRFARNWPEGSPAQRSYGERLRRGPDFGPEQALPALD